MKNSTEEEAEQGVKKVTTLWSAGHGMRGYLPESAPVIFTDWASAVEYTITELTNYGEYFVSGMDPVWLSFYENTVKESTDDNVREDDCDINLVWEFILNVKDGLWDEGIPMDDIQYDMFKGLLECEILIRELRRGDPSRITPDQSWGGYAGNYHYFIEEVDRSDCEIPLDADLEGEELEDKIQEINEEGW